MSVYDFLEDQALHAALNDDEDALQDALDGLLPNELMALADAADSLSVAARRKSYAKRDRIKREPTDANS